MAAHKKLGLNFTETQECVTASFSERNPGDWKKSTSTNSLIEAEIQYMKDYGTYIFPSIVINNKTYRGQLEEEAVTNALCAGFETPPKICGQFNFSESASTGWGINSKTIIMVVAVLIIVNILIVYCYRRYARREMQREMHVQIESAVS